MYKNIELVLEALDCLLVIVTILPTKWQTFCVNTRLALLALVFIILVLDIQDSEAWWWRRRTKSSNCNGGKPYYFGTTNLWCIKKYKRGAAPSRGTWTLKHRWIYYEGFYFERLGNGEVYGNKPTAASKCSWRRESSPAGYSSLSVNCIKRCTEKYRARYGRYRLLSNNCHHFANNTTNTCLLKRVKSLFITVWLIGFVDDHHSQPFSSNITHPCIKIDLRYVYLVNIKAFKHLYI
ncbi:LOW QUALITY PROTEIN: hypothetical protein KUTeg_023568 [Tegillarca granosa]|uniref:Uncharacterized protein n=1 Tax=Tegillarca granosa TaxID=220873 RepID=A0ABQ9E241_TEGGR|nr:LOW QUALITY PROTEIN: hypothetical protein KUTeg_023568 [Tegillarca granosa]